MKIRQGTFLFTIFILLAILSACKKDSPTNNTGYANVDTSIIGLWKIELLTISYYDSSGAISMTDTLTFTDNYGNNTTAFEEYTKDNKFYFLADSTADTSLVATYTKNGNNLIIADSSYLFNNRTITVLNSQNMQQYQMFNNKSPKQKWIQNYIRE